MGIKGGILMGAESDDGNRILNEAVEEAKKSGWTHELKEKFVLGCGMVDSGTCGDTTIIQHFFIHDGDDDKAWEEYSDGETWVDYIDKEFNYMYAGDVDE